MNNANVVSGKKILVTGATGLMGTVAMNILLNVSDVYIRAVRHSRLPMVYDEKIEWVEADLMNRSDCHAIVEGVDIVFMFAGVLATAPVIHRNPIAPLTENTVINVQMLEAAWSMGVKQFVWLGSATGYPDSDTPLREDDMFLGDPPDVYFSIGWMSRYVEVICRMYATKLNRVMSTIIIKPTTIYGEYEGFDFETCHMLPALVRRVSEHQNPLRVWGTGEVKRDLIHAEDVFRACLLAMTNKDNFAVYNAGFGKEYSIKEIIKMILREEGNPEINIEYDLTKPTTVNRRQLDFEKIRTLGFKPKIELQIGIRRLLKYYHETWVPN